MKEMGKVSRKMMMTELTGKVVLPRNEHLEGGSFRWREWNGVHLLWVDPVVTNYLVSLQTREYKNYFTRPFLGMIDFNTS